LGLESIARFLLILGGLLILVGLVVFLAGKLGLGRLPGDIILERENFVFYFPLTTAIIISIILTLLLNLLLRR